jgi:nucleoside-diphosphate-sugar epimerase
MNIDTSSPVMLTGSTGYVAGVICKELLEAGLTVHCPVRNPDSADKLKHLTDLAAASKGKLKFFKADLLDHGSYLESMKGCSVVIHTASPFNMSPKDVQKDLLDPAIKGTQNVLNSVSKTPTVKRVVITSSVYAIATDPADTHEAPGTEESWNFSASETYNPYAYSKKLAEKEAWRIADAQKQYKLVVVNPAWVHGPGLKASAGNESFAFIKMMGDGAMKSGCANMGFWVVDVRDVAKAHVAAAFTEKAEGRYIISGCNTNLPAIAAAILAKFPDYPLPESCFPWPIVYLLAPYIGMTRQMVWRGVNVEGRIDNSKSIKDLKMDYRSMESTFQDMFKQMVDAGMINTPEPKK